MGMGMGIDGDSRPPAAGRFAFQFPERPCTVFLLLARWRYLLL